MLEISLGQLVAAAIVTAVLTLSFILSQRQRVAAGLLSKLRSLASSLLGGLVGGGLFLALIAAQAGVDAGTLGTSWSVGIMAFKAFGFVLIIAGIGSIIWRRLRRS